MLQFQIWRIDQDTFIISYLLYGVKTQKSQVTAVAKSGFTYVGLAADRVQPLVAICRKKRGI